MIYEWDKNEIIDGIEIKISMIYQWGIREIQKQYKKYIKNTQIGYNGYKWHTKGKSKWNYK